MTQHSTTDLVGILVGSIMENTPPLAFYLYATPNQRSHVRVHELQQFSNQHQAAASLARAFAPGLRDVWFNAFHPCWYYLQFAPAFGPSRLQVFGLPWSVYHDWEVHLDAE